MSLRRFVPLFDRVLVKKIDPITQTKSGVLLPEKSSRPLTATVVEVGPGPRDKVSWRVSQEGKFLKMSVKVGDEVVIPEYGGTKVELDDVEHFVFKESDILGKIEK